MQTQSLLKLLNGLRNVKVGSVHFAKISIDDWQERLQKHIDAN